MNLRNAPIVVATDFSTRSDRALRRATMIAKQFDASLSLVHVVDDDLPQYLVKAQMEASRSILEEAARTITEMDGVAAQAIVESGDVFSGILRVSDEVEARLIVMGPHRRQLRDAFIGTTAERTIAHTRRPVLMTAGVPSAHHDRVLIALGMDEASKSAAHRVRDLGLLDRADIIAMHAFDAPAEGMMKRAMSEPEAINHYVVGEGRRADADFSAFVAETGLGAARRLLLPVHGTAARTIVEAARGQEADLIVLGTHQKTGIKRFFLGSVAADVIGEADCDVLVMPNP